MCSKSHDCGTVHKKILEEGIKKGRLEFAREVNSLLVDDKDIEEVVGDIDELVMNEFNNRELV